MSEEYDLKKSAKKIGQLYPVILSKTGEIVDGFHRLDADKDWRTEVNPEIDSYEKLLKARLISNKFRRQVPATEVEKWINELAKISIKEYNIEPGQISRWIADETGYERDTVSRYLSEKYKTTPKGVAADQSLKIKGIESPQTSLISEVEEKFGPEKTKKLKEEFRKEIQEDIALEYDIPELYIPEKPDRPQVKIKHQELRDIGKELGKGVKSALIKLDKDIKTSKPKRELITNLISIRLIKEKLLKREIFNPFDKEATLAWTSGHSLDEVEKETKRLLEKKE